MPRLLDLFCGAGGASMGYALAGWEVVGIDCEPQTTYPFPLIQMKAGKFMESGGWKSFDAIHASPPCQHYSRRGREGHPDLIGVVRQQLVMTGLPFVIENIPDAKPWLRDPILLCGTMFKLAVQRHRYFEINWYPPPMRPGPCRHQPSDLRFDHRDETSYGLAMEIDWMTNKQVRDAIPPAYTRLLGESMLRMTERSTQSATPVPVAFP